MYLIEGKFDVADERTPRVVVRMRKSFDGMVPTTVFRHPMQVYPAIWSRFSK
jgi:hypothetical protein